MYIINYYHLSFIIYESENISLYDLSIYSSLGILYGFIWGKVISFEYFRLYSISYGSSRHQLYLVVEDQAHGWTDSSQDVWVGTFPEAIQAIFVVYFYQAIDGASIFFGLLAGLHE